jgi:hypothetical protein
MIRKAWVIGALASWLAATSCGADSSVAPDGGAGGAGGAGVTGGGGQLGTIDISVDGGARSRGNVRMAVPAYFAPGAEWQRLIAAAPTVGMIIFNPDSGPGTVTRPEYTAAIAQAQAAGIIVLGYVWTDYGRRAEADIAADINRTYDLYTPSGIYLAEGPEESDCAPMEAAYHRLADAARTRDARAFLAVGTRFCPTYIFFFDAMVQFARNWTEYQHEYQPPSWMPANSADRFVHFINAVPSADAGRALSTAIGNGAGWVFVTDGADPNPWGGLPSYFDAEIAALRH